MKETSGVLRPTRLLPLCLCLACAWPLPAEETRLSLLHPYQVASARLPLDLARRYAVYRVSALPRGEGLRWVFVSRQEQAELYGAWGTVPSARQYRAAVRLSDGGAAEAALVGQRFDRSQQAGPTQRLVRGAWTSLSLEPEGPGFRRLLLRLTGLRPGAKYVLDWRDLAWEPGPPASAPSLNDTLAPPDSSAWPQDPGASPAILLEAELLESDYAPAATDPHLYRLPVAAAFSPYGESADVWLGPGRFDYSEVDTRLAALLQCDPEAQVLLRVDLDSPPWWEEQHPESLVPTPKTVPDLLAERKLAHASWFAPGWQEAAKQALQSLVRHVEQARYRERIIGYELDSGRGGRWVPWHQSAECQETSAAAQAAFRAWLQKKYGSLTTLRVAWGQPRQPVLDSPEVKAGYIFTQWAQIKVPPAAYMLDPKSPSLYDPSGQQHLADYQQFLGEFTADLIVSLIKAGREASAGNRIWGACYGHLLWWPEEEWPPSLAGHLGLAKLRTEPAVEFLVGPPGAPLVPTTVTASLALHRKRYLEQPAPEAALPADRPFAGGVICRTLEQARAAARSEFDTVPPQPRPEPRWAYVLDEQSLAHLGPGTDLQRVTLVDQAREVAVADPRWDPWLLADLAAAPEGYQGYLMAATYFLPPEVRTAFSRRCQRPGTLTVWLYAAGALDGGFIDPSAIFRLTGFKTTMLGPAGSLRIEVPPGEPYFTPLSDQPLQFGPRLAIQPRFVLVTGEDTVGTIPGSQWPGVGMRREQGALIAYSAAPGIPGEALRRLAEAAHQTSIP